MSSQETSSPARRTVRPTATWVCMVLALIMTLTLPTVANFLEARVVLDGSAGWALYLSCVPILLGLLGMVFALVQGRNVWAALSGLWGFVIIFTGFMYVVSRYGF